MKTYIGIDNGLNGAIAVLSPGAAMPVLHPMPLRIAGKDKRLDARAFYKLISDIAGEKFVAVEQAQSFSPGKSALTSTWRTWGSIQTVLDLMGVPYQPLNPQFWQKVMFAGVRKKDQDTKSASIEVAQRLWPTLRLVRGGERASKPDDGFSDAALIAEWARRENL